MISAPMALLGRGSAILICITNQIETVACSAGHAGWAIIDKFTCILYLMSMSVSVNKRV